MPNEAGGSQSDFNDAGFDYYGVHSRFLRKDGQFLVETDGPDGKVATFAAHATAIRQAIRQEPKERRGRR